MGKKYVATIMNRVYLGDEKFIYYVSHPAIGEYNEKERVFKDMNKHEYLHITEPGLFMTEITNAFANITEMKDLPKQMNEDTMEDALAAYSYLCSRNIYYVSKTDDNKIFSTIIDLDEIRDTKGQKNNNSKRIEIDSLRQILAEQTPKLSQGIHSSTYEVEDEHFSDELIADYMHSGDVKDDIATILLDMIDGLYSLEDLKEIQEIAREHRDAVNGLLDSIEQQIDYVENPSSKPKNKKVENLRKVLLDDRIDIEDLYKKITKTLIAQDEPVARVLTELARKEQKPELKDRGLLITGESGSGKSKMMQLIAKYLDRPFIKIDATQLTIPGYVGKDIEVELWRLYNDICNKDLQKAEKAIVYFEEIDKKGSAKKEDVSGRGVLNVLLPFIEGSTYEATADTKTRKEVVDINTSNMITILGGAFTDVYKDLKAKSSLGFGADVKSKDAKREATIEDFIKKAKMPDEFMGRVSIVKMNDLDIEAIKRIMLESDESIVKIQKDIFDQLGVKLTLDDSYLEAIAKQALDRKTGARGLNTVVDDTTWVAYRDAYSNNGVYDEIILTDETVKNPKVYKKVYKQSNEK